MVFGLIEGQCTQHALGTTTTNMAHNHFDAKILE
jgi:hypothetical protein